MGRAGGGGGEGGTGGGGGEGGCEEKSAEARRVSHTITPRPRLRLGGVREEAAGEARRRASPSQRPRELLAAPVLPGCGGRRFIVRCPRALPPR